MARKIEPMVLDRLRALTIPEATRDAVIDEVRRRLARPVKPIVSTASLREQHRRLKAAYLAGDPDLTDEIYFRERDRLQRLIDQEPAPTAEGLDVERATALLSDIPKLLEVATSEQQRSLVQQVTEKVWLEKTKVTAMQPSPTYMPLVEALVSRATSTGLRAPPSTAARLLRAPRWAAFQLPSATVRQ